MVSGRSIKNNRDHESFATGAWRAGSRNSTKKLVPTARLDRWGMLSRVPGHWSTPLANSLFPIRCGAVRVPVGLRNGFHARRLVLGRSPLGNWWVTRVIGVIACYSPPYRATNPRIQIIQPLYGMNPFPRKESPPSSKNPTVAFRPKVGVTMEVEHVDYKRLAQLCRSAGSIWPWRQCHKEW